MRVMCTEAFRIGRSVCKTREAVSVLGNNYFRRAGGGEDSSRNQPEKVEKHKDSQIFLMAMSKNGNKRFNF